MQSFPLRPFGRSPLIFKRIYRTFVLCNDDTKEMNLKESFPFSTKQLHGRQFIMHWFIMKYLSRHVGRSTDTANPYFN